jgi:hypothetical protein
MAATLQLEAELTGVRDRVAIALRECDIDVDDRPVEPPRPARIWPITNVSRTFGTLLRVTVSLVSRAAAISGSAAFFEPLMQMLPAS